MADSIDSSRQHPRRRIAVAVAACLIGVCALSASSASAHVPRNFYGIIPSTGLGEHDFKRIANARVGSLRFGIFWPGVQPARGGPFYWSATDQLVARAAKRHISLLPILTGTPSYEAHGCSTRGCQTHIHLDSKAEKRDWKRFVHAAVERYGRHGSFWSSQPGLPYDPIGRWQIWNEQNNPNERNPAKLYAKLLALSDRAISSADPHGKAILGGMPGQPNGPKSVAAWNYLGRLYKHGARKHLHGVALHPYSATISGIRRQISKTRRVMRRHHDGSTQILITEIGWGSDPKKHHAGTGSRGQAFVVSPKEQKKKLAKSFGLLTEHRRKWRIGGVFWYGWKDPRHAPPGLCAFCYSSGLYKANGETAKPALTAYKRFTRKTRG